MYRQLVLKTIQIRITNKVIFFDEAVIEIDEIGAVNQVVKFYNI